MEGERLGQSAGPPHVFVFSAMLRGLSGYCTHLFHWLLWRKWHFNSLCFFSFRNRVRMWLSVCICERVFWPNTSPKWGQASHTLHSACLAGTLSANQDQLGSPFQYRYPLLFPVPIILLDFGETFLTSIFPSFHFSLIPFRPHSLGPVINFLCL